MNIAHERGAETHPYMNLQLNVFYSYGLISKFSVQHSSFLAKKICRHLLGTKEKRLRLKHV